jgi:uncharacterized membrane protein YhaH (DUF805 family)
MGLFSMEGRYNRAKYFWITLAITVLGPIVILGPLIAFSGSPADPDTASVVGIFGLTGYIGIFAVSAFQVVKRLHDLGRPGYHYWLLVIPFYNIYFSLVLLFKKGTKGQNEYGPDPLAGK